MCADWVAIGSVVTMSDEQPKAPADGSRELSDLIGVELTLGLGVWFLIVLAAFFFVGAVAGVVALALGVLGFGSIFVRAIGRADTSD